MTKCKVRAVPLQARRGPEGSRKLRFPDFMTTAQDGGKVVSLTHRPPLLTYSMVQSPSWAANLFAASQEIPRISRNPNVHYRTHKRPPTVSILGQLNPVHIPTPHLLEIRPNIIHPSTPRSPQWPAAFTPRKYSWYSFLLEAESTPWPKCDRKDFMSMKNPMTSPGIEPATLRFVAQHLNHCATAVPKRRRVGYGSPG